MLRFFLFILSHVYASSIIKSYPVFTPKEESLNDYCQGLSTIISTKIVHYGNNSHINYINNCFNNIPQSKPLNGGAANIINASHISIIFCTFSNNIYGANGGAIYFISSLYTIDYCIFYNNRALGSGGAIYSSNLQSIPKLKSENEIKNTYFTKNTAKLKGGGVYINNHSQFFLKNVTFESNEALNGASIYFDMTNRHKNLTLSINIQTCIFHIKSTNSQAHLKSNIEITNYEVINFTSCQFKLTSDLTARTINFFHLFAPNSYIYFKGKNLVDCPNTTFKALNELYPNVIFNYNFEKIQIKSKNTDNLPSRITAKAAVISSRQQYVEIQKNVRIIKSTFHRITSYENGGAVYLAFCPRVSIKSVFFNIIKTTMNGGSIYSNQSQIEIFDSNFSSNSCLLEGGAIFIDVQYLFLRYFNIMNCTFENNEANMNGGAISIKNSLNLLISKCTFKSNYANMNGLSIYSYGVNDFIFYLISSSFYSNDELKKSEIELNSFQIFFVQNCFFTSQIPSNNNSIDDKIYLKGKEVILWIVSGCCCLNTSQKSSVQMNVFNPFNLIHLNCTNHTIDTNKKQITDSNSTLDENQSKNDKRSLVGIVEFPKKNIFLKEIECDSIVIFNNTVNDDYELKKFGENDRVLPLSSQEINVTLFPDQNGTNSYEFLFLNPVLNDSKICIQNENESVEQHIGLFYQNVNSEIVLNQNNSLISVKGTGTVTFSTSKNQNFDFLNFNTITVSDSVPLNLSFLDQFKAVTVDNIDFFIRGSLNFKSNETIVSVQNVTIHQEADVKINSIKLCDELVFKANSKLEVTDEIKFDEKSVLIFEFNESTKIGNFFHHKDDSENHSIAILTIPSFSKDTSGIPKKIIIREGIVVTSLSEKPSTDYYLPLNHLQRKRPAAQSYNLNMFELKSMLYNSLPNSKLQSSLPVTQSDNNIDDTDSENLSIQTEFQSNVSHYSLNDLVLICSDDFDLDFCTYLVSPNKTSENWDQDSDFIVFENDFAECDCIINDLNQTCIIIIDNSDKEDGLRYVHLSVGGLVGVIFGSLAAIAALSAVIFVANGNNFLSFSNARI